MKKVFKLSLSRLLRVMVMVMVKASRVDWNECKKVKVGPDVTMNRLRDFVKTLSQHRLKACTKSKSI